ncbi:hypothetical protein [Xanthocytophaga agilis]|uniref:hypothetical protein n=1 Tax=Xanthocytophaga agilis TaxID=3048010 RepID=UPI0028D0C4C9|nr:hypothetical protein [Xanthocytophaga agilis]
MRSSTKRGLLYMNAIMIRGDSTVGLGYNKKEDITENHLHEEQGQNKRGAY